MRCPLCKREVASYYTIQDRVPACEPCLRGLQSQMGDVTAGKIARGGAFGCGAALALSIATGIAFAVSVDVKPVGYLGGIGCLFAGSIVAGAVRKGARGAGGPALQAVAIIASLLAIFFSPAVVSVRESFQAKVDLPVPLKVIGAILISPILFFAAGGIFALACTGFAVYDSWRRTKRMNLDVKGPFTEDPNAPSAPAPPPPAADARAAGLDFERPVQ